MFKAILIAALLLMIGVSATQAQDATPQVGELVTNAQFAAFIPLLDYDKFPAELQITPPSGVPINDRPFRIATWHEANAFCEYYRLELPSAEQLKEVDRRAEVNEWVQSDTVGSPYHYLDEGNVEQITYQTFLFAEHIMFRCVEETDTEAELDCETIEAWFAKQDILEAVKKSYADDCEGIAEVFYEPAMRADSIEDIFSSTVQRAADNCPAADSYAEGEFSRQLYQKLFLFVGMTEEISFESFRYLINVLEIVLNAKNTETFCAIAELIVNGEIDFSVSFELNADNLYAEAIPTVNGNLRSMPTTDSDVVGYTRAGTEVLLFGQTDEWYLVWGRDSENLGVVAFANEILFQ